MFLRYYEPPRRKLQLAAGVPEQALQAQAREEEEEEEESDESIDGDSSDDLGMYSSPCTLLTHTKRGSTLFNIEG